MPIPDSVVGLLGFILVFVLIFLKLPVAFAFGSIGFLGTWYLGGLGGLGAALDNLPVVMWYKMSGYLLTCLPLFLLMGQFAFLSGIGPDLYETSLKWWGRMPGGLALTTAWGCCAFGAVTGASTAAVLTFTPIAWKPMLDLGYDKRLAAGSIICSSTMASLIPPSAAFIIYAAVTNESIGRLFIAGIFPGILEAILYVIVIIFLAGLGIQPGPPGPHSSLKEKIVSLKKVWGMLTIFTLVIGGIYAGIFTPTEGAAVGAAGTLIILVFRQGFNLRLIARGLEETARTTGMVFLIIVLAMIFAQFLALSGLSAWLVSMISGTDLNPYVILAAALGVLLIAGCIMPVTPMVLLFVPLYYPIFVSQYGFDGIWFGVIVVVMMEIGLVTPPVGFNLFVFLGMVKEDISVMQMWQGVIPFVIADVIRAVILIAFPVIVLWLPSTMLKF